MSTVRAGLGHTIASPDGEEAVRRLLDQARIIVTYLRLTKEGFPGPPVVCAVGDDSERLALSTAAARMRLLGAATARGERGGTVRAMGYNVGAYGPSPHDGERPELLGSMKVGIYGSQDVLMALLLAGYSLGHFPHSDRIRGSWVQRMPGWGLEFDDADLPPWADIRTRSGFASWVAFNGRDCTWLALSESSIDRGRKLKPVECDTLAALLTFYDKRNDWNDPGGGVVDGQALMRLADAVASVEPLVRASCWWPVVSEFSTLVTAAARAGGSLRYG